MALHVIHFSMEPVTQPLLQMLLVFIQVDATDTTILKAQLLGEGFNFSYQTVG